MILQKYSFLYSFIVLSKKIDFALGLLTDRRDMECCIKQDITFLNVVFKSFQVNRFQTICSTTWWGSKFWSKILVLLPERNISILHGYHHEGDVVNIQGRYIMLFQITLKYYFFVEN